MWIYVNQELFLAELDFPPANQVLFSSRILGTLALHEFKIVKKVPVSFVIRVYIRFRGIWVKVGSGWNFSFGLQQQPQAQDHPVISDARDLHKG